MRGTESRTRQKSRNGGGEKNEAWTDEAGRATGAVKCSESKRRRGRSPARGDGRALGRCTRQQAREITPNTQPVPSGRDKPSQTHPASSPYYHYHSLALLHTTRPPRRLQVLCSSSHVLARRRRLYFNRPRSTLQPRSSPSPFSFPAIESRLVRPPHVAFARRLDSPNSTREMRPVHVLLPVLGAPPACTLAH